MKVMACWYNKVLHWFWPFYLDNIIAKDGISNMIQSPIISSMSRGKTQSSLKHKEVKCLNSAGLKNPGIPDLEQDKRPFYDLVYEMFSINFFWHNEFLLAKTIMDT